MSDLSSSSLVQLLSVLKSNSLLKPKAHTVLSVAGLDAGKILRYIHTDVEVPLCITQRAVFVAFYQSLRDSCSI